MITTQQFADQYERGFGYVVKAISTKFALQPDRVEDVVQAAFVRAWEKLDQFRGDCDIKTWVVTIAVRMILTDIRRNGYAPVIFTDTLPEMPTSFDTYTKLTIDRILSLLPKAYREVLEMRYLNDMSIEEAATVLDVPIGTVKCHTHRALAMAATI